MRNRARVIHRQIRLSHAGNQELEVGQFKMNVQELVVNAMTLVAGDKGFTLAMDGSNLTCNKRFASFGILPTEESQRTMANTMP